MRPQRSKPTEIVPPSESESEDDLSQESVDLSSEESDNISDDGDPLASAKQQLHPTARPASLPCREDEFEDILNYLTSAIQSGDGCCICKRLPSASDLIWQTLAVSLEQARRPLCSL